AWHGKPLLVDDGPEQFESVWTGVESLAKLRGNGSPVQRNELWCANRRPPAMTPEVQREALAVLAEVWALSPGVRLGQLLAHLGFLGEAHLGRGLGYIEDDELIAVLYRHRAELLARLP